LQSALLYLPKIGIHLTTYGKGICSLMNTMKGSTSQDNYKWYILTLAALTFTIVVAMPTMALPVLFKEMSEDLGLSLVQIGAVWGFGSLTGILSSLIGGPIGDRFGAKRTLTVLTILVGISGALRGLAVDFATMTATVFLFGFVALAVPMNIHKTCGIWFSKRNLGLANGIVSAGMAFGFMLGAMISATVLSPWLGGWRNVLFLYGALSIVMSIPWALSRPAPEEDSAASSHGSSGVSMRQTFLHVAWLKNLWWLGLGLMGIGGAVQGMLGYLPLYLREIGWPAAQADGALATFHAMSMLMVIPFSFLSDRLGARKKLLILAGLGLATGFGLLSVVAGSLVWASVIISGMFRDGFMAIFMTTAIETEGVGPTYAGTAVGFTLVFLFTGNTISPPIGNSLAAISPSLPFAFWATMAVLGLLSLYFVKETGTREQQIIPGEGQPVEAV